MCRSPGVGSEWSIVPGFSSPVRIDPPLQSYHSYDTSYPGAVRNQMPTYGRPAGRAPSSKSMNADSRSQQGGNNENGIACMLLTGGHVLVGEEMRDDCL